jgi:TPR repeat protein
MKCNKLTISTLCLLIAGLATGCFEDRWEKEVAETPPEFKVSVADICRAFDLDKSAANQKYKGKVIEVYGSFQEKWSEGERTLVVLSGGKELELHCLVSQQSDLDLVDFKAGRPTMIKGKCRGVVRGNLAMGGCIIKDPLRGLKTKARSGDLSAQVELAKALSKTTDPVHDLRRSFHLFCKAAAAGHEESKALVMASLAGGWSPETNAPVIWKWLREEAEDGNAEACYLVGILYNVDEEFGIDPKASVPWFKKASDSGHPEAIITMARIHYDGILVPTNKVETVRLLSLVDPRQFPSAPESLGIMTLIGEGTTQDTPRGISLLETAASYGQATSAALLGRIYLAGKVVPQDEKKALQWFLKAGELGDARSMAKAGLMIKQVKNDASQVRGHKLVFAALSNNMNVAYSEIFSHMADSVIGQMENRNPPLETNDMVRFRRINGTLIQGTVQEVVADGLVIAVGTSKLSVPFAELDVAARIRCDPAFRALLSASLVTERAYEEVAGFSSPTKPFSKSDFEQAIQALKSMAEDGFADAQAWLGQTLLEEEMTEEGIKWLKKAVEGGSSDGQYELAQVIFSGHGLPVDKKESFRLFSLASDQGHSDAMLMAGRMLMAGDGCERNMTGGLELVRQAAYAENPQAILLMGRYCYGDHRGMRDAAQAFAWFRLGSILGEADSQYWLGRIYYEGKGVPQDYNRSIQWMMESASQNSDFLIPSGKQGGAAESDLA